MTGTFFVTGASSGIGAAAARRMAAEGWRAALSARSLDKVEALAAEIGADRARAFALDATDLAATEAAMAATADAFGGIDAVFANAGLGASGPGLGGGDPENWREMIETNCLGLVLTCRAALPHLERSKGRLLLTGSAAGRRHLPGSVYGATKWFVHGLAGNLRLELEAKGIKTTVIAPGMVDTPFFSEAKPQALRVDDVADAIAYALTAPAHVSVGEVFLTPNRN